MATREEIREGTEKILEEVFSSLDHWDCSEECGHKVCLLEWKNEVTSKVLSYLHSQGVVIKVDRELPEVTCFKLAECGYKHNCSHAVPHKDSGEFCRHFSYNPCPCPKLNVAVEPLIEDGKDNSGK